MANVPNIVKYERTREVYKFMVNVSKQRKEIVHFFSKKWTKDGFFAENISEKSKHRTIDNYIRKVKDTFFNFEEEIESEKGRTLARLDDLYQNSIKIQDYKGALAVLREIGEIVGFKAPKHIDHSSKDGSMSPVKLSPEEIKKINNKLDAEV